MKFKHSDIEIPREDPFKNCKLNRQPNAIILTNTSVKIYRAKS